MTKLAVSRTRRLTLIGAAAAAAFAVGISGQWATGAGTDPTTEPVPQPEYVDDARSFAAMLDFTSGTSATPASVTVVNGVRPGTEHLHRDLLVSSRAGDAILDEFTVPNPSTALMHGVGEIFQAGRQLLMVPFDTRADSIVVTDIASGQQVVAIDTAGAIGQVCTATPTAPECAYDLTTELTAGPDPVPAGTPLGYVLTVRNTGTGPALGTNAVVTLPFAPVEVPAGCTAAGVELTCALDRISAGGSTTVSVSVTVPAGHANGGTGTSTVETSATATSSVWAESDTDDNPSSLTSAVVAVSDLAVTKTGVPAEATANDPVTYTVGVSNAGPSDADVLRVTDQLPPAAEAGFVSAELPGGTCTTAGTPPASVTCELSTPLAPGGQVTMMVVVAISDTGVATAILDAAEASSASTDPVAGNNRAEAGTGVLLAPTGLAVDPVILRVKPLTLEVNLGQLSAVLSRGDREAPVAGRVLRFEAGGRLLCTAVTDATGRATCTGLSVSLAALLNFGYTVRFEADGRYLPVEQDGELVVVWL